MKRCIKNFEKISFSWIKMHGKQESKFIFLFFYFFNNNLKILNYQIHLVQARLQYEWTYMGDNSISLKCPWKGGWIALLISKQAQGYKTWENKLYNNGKVYIAKGMATFVV
jgi:hypothetical protein